MNKRNLTKEDILHIAALSMINLSEEGAERIRGDLISVMSHVKKLFEIDITGVPETAQVTGLKNVIRDDVITNPSGKKNREKMLANAPAVKNGYILVPRVLY